MNPQPELHGRTIHVSVREARMCVDRILLLARVPSGYVSAVRECILLSQARGLGGFADLLTSYRELDMRRFADIGIEHIDEGTLRIDGAGTHAWLLAPTVTDLVVDVARKRGRGCVQIRGAAAMSELRIIGELAKRYGAAATLLESHSDGVSSDCMLVTMTNAARPRTLEQANPMLHEALLHGFPMNGALWREVHALSNQALAPDSVVSRRHAGPVILQDDGTLFGRVPADDDFDLKMLNAIPSTPAGSPP